MSLYFVRSTFLLMLCLFSVSVFSSPKEESKNICDDNSITTKLNGVEVNLAIDATLKSYVILNPEPAKKAGLKKSFFSSVKKYVRDKTIKGSVDEAKIEIRGKERKVRVVWFERNYVHDSRYDGVIGLNEIGTNSVKLNFCSQNLNSDDESYVTKTIPFKYENKRVLVESVLPDRLDVMFDLNHRHINIGSDAYSYMLSEGMLKKSNQYAYQELEFGYYLPSRKISLITSILNGVVVDSENVFTPISEHQMVDDQSGSIDGEYIDAIEEVVTYGYKPKKDAEFKSFIKLGSSALPNCRSLTFDLKNKLINLSCLESKNE
ncbi:hypothetical protein [Gilvimarinus chinensis]|uniref:hypothetical protein n=1 Tax=Gilvimarinus chinensis TaxID=396005 RepID=UPI0012FACDC8|nr:hypothetical protein [Gilvimarinus chinensis]